MRRRPTKNRHGIIALEVAMFIATIFVIAMLLYWVAQAGFTGLYQIISGHNGSPYL